LTQYDLSEILTYHAKAEISGFIDTSIYERLIEYWTQNEKIIKRLQRYGAQMLEEYISTGEL
jgi:hypothetical protein